MPRTKAPSRRRALAVIGALGGEGPKEDAFAHGVAWAIGYISDGAVKVVGFDVDPTAIKLRAVRK